MLIFCAACVPSLFRQQQERGGIHSEGRSLPCRGSLRVAPTHVSQPCPSMYYFLSSVDCAVPTDLRCGVLECKVVRTPVCMSSQEEARRKWYC